MFNFSVVANPQQSCAVQSLCFASLGGIQGWLHMKITQGLGFIVLLLAQAAQAQTHYEQLEVGTTVQGGIGLGMFSKPYPLPPGQWVVAGRTVREIPLFNSQSKEPAGSVSRYDLTLKNAQPGGMLPLMVASITGRLTNLNLGAKPCNPSVDKNKWVDSLSERASPTSVGVQGCAITVGISNFKKYVADAGVNDNAWMRAVLSPMAAEAYGMPDNALMVSVAASRFRGHNIEAAFFVRQEGNLSDPAYANHLRPWVRATGLSLMAVVDNNASTLELPPPFVRAMADGKPVVIDNRPVSTLPDAVPLGNLQIQKKFDLIEVRPDNFKATLLSCIPEFASNIATIYVPPPTVQQAIYKVGGSARQFILKKTVGLCLNTSAANFPVFAAEAFLGTVKPQGVSDEVVAEWNTQIATLIARQGRANVAYQYGNQSILAVKYWMDPGSPLTIRYTTQYKPQGEWDKQAFEAVFADPALSAVASINVNAKGEGKKDLPF